MTDRQTDLFTDLPRGEQLAALRRLKLEPGKHGSAKVSAAILKSVIRQVDDHSGDRGCFATQETIAAEIGRSEKTVMRAIAVLVERNLLTSDRPNRWSSNRHRVVWQTVFDMTAGEQNCNEDDRGDTVSVRPDIVFGRGDMVSVGTGHGVRSEGTQCPLGPDRVSPESPSKPNLIDQPTAPWQAVAVAMKKWGLASADVSLRSARDRGLSIELVAELFREAGGDREPERWEPGQLANWLTGRRPPPFDESEANRRRDDRERAQSDRADGIRHRLATDGQAGHVPPWVIHGTTFRRLRDAGLDRFATGVERDAATKMDAVDRQRVPA